MLAFLRGTVGLLLIFFLAPHPGLRAQAERISANGTRLYFGPGFGFYKVNKNHALSPVSRASLVAGFRRELRVSRDHKSFFLFGAEYFFHGLSFRSYYFRPDTVKLYDRSFAYTYRMTIHEMNVPLQYKYLFRAQNNYLFSPYIALNYHLRYLLSGQVLVDGEGREVAARQVLMKFRTPLLHRQLNAFVSFSFGWQKNSLRNSTSSFFMELNYRYGFSPYFFEEDFAPSSLYIRSTHLALMLGVKF